MLEKKGNLNILLVDPNDSRLHQIKEQFSKDTHHPTRVETANSIPEAIEKCGKSSFHLILADIQTPAGEDVADLLAHLNRAKSKTPLILLVEPGEEARAHRAIKAGAADYLVKQEGELQNLPDRLWTIYRTFELTDNQEGFSTEVAKQNQKLLAVNEKLRDLSIRDDLTGLYNHRYLQERLTEEFTRALRYGYPLSCVILDLDLFRRINESLSHTVGDEILKSSAELLLESCRLSDLIARFGGEEFVILLPHVDYQGAFELGERLCEVFAQKSFLPESHQLSVTASIGISSFPDDMLKNRNDLIHFAEQALFRAKAAGRNRVILYRDILPTIGEMLPKIKISEEKVLEFQKRLSEIADTARRGYIESSKALIMALESKDPYTAGHSSHVARLSMQVAEAMGLPLDEAEVIEHAGLLHDIGKICISDEILLKPDRLTLAEYEAMKQHPYLGYRILKPIKFLQQEATLVLHHHEWFNGQGYPCRLARNEIPVGARIISVVDSYDTMQHAGGRYKKTVSTAVAVNEIIACAGTQFDPEVVQVFVQVLLMRKELNPGAYDQKGLRRALESAIDGHQRIPRD